MKFIFPHNYNFSTKLFGLIDYPTAILNFVSWIVIFCFTKIFGFSIIGTVVTFILICFPIFLISISGFQHENVIYVFKYVLKYVRSNKIYLYLK